ncbi:MAG: hypothetical protein ACO1TE_01890 [Prosthecobacter sp.]
MSSPRLRPSTLLLALGVIALIAAWLLRPEAAPTAVSVPQKMVVSTYQTAPVQRTPAAAPPPGVPAPPSVPTPGGKSEMQAYRLAVRAGTVSLDAVERITGDFRQRRGPLPWMPGMWCVRLLDADMRVLAEETAAAPDALCVVLDPHNKDPTGGPQATQFAGGGEEAMLQVRLPPRPGAKWLKVYRLAGMERADWNTEPIGEVLASISLP